jgi:hypothetical protein
LTIWKAETVQITVTLPGDLAAPLLPLGQEPARTALGPLNYLVLIAAVNVPEQLDRAG